MTSGDLGAATTGPPIVSVIMPVYNGAAFVAQAIASVLSQTFAELELIIVDDGSTDQTAAAVAEFRDSRLLYVHQANRGVSAARNLGIARTTAPWVAFLDSDDRWLPTKLDAQLAALRSAPEAGAVYCGATYCNERGDVLADLPARMEGDALNALLLGNPISMSTGMVRRSVLDKVGTFKDDILFCEDWELWLRIAEATTFVRVEERLVVIVDRSNSLGKRADEMRDSSIRLLEAAFTRHGRDRAHLRSRALWRVYMAAAITHQEHRRFGKALKDLAKAVRHNPVHLPTYWRIARVLAGRP
jgi:glycosyltransferase involved in cell wall biosynthesis